MQIFSTRMSERTICKLMTKQTGDDLTPADVKALSRLVATIRKEAGKR